MSNIATLARDAYRQYVTDGVPTSGPKRPDKIEIIEIFDRISRHIDPVNVFSVAAYGALGDNAANDTAAFQAWRSAVSTAIAGGNSDCVAVIPPGVYRIDEAADFNFAGMHRIVFQPGARIADLAGSVFDEWDEDGQYLGDPLYQSVGVLPGTDTSRRYMHIHGIHRVTDQALGAQAQGMPTWGVTLAYQGTSVADAYKVGAFNIQSFVEVGRGLSGSAKASGSVAAVSSGIHIHRATNGPVGRSEHLGGAFYAQVANGANTAVDDGINIWGLEVTVGGKVSATTGYDGMLWGGVYMVHKRSAGRPSGAEYNGSGGLVVCTRPGSSGFNPEGIDGTVRTYSLESGLHIVGWSGPSTATDGYHASAEDAFFAALRVGGLRGGPWLATTARSRVARALSATDYTVAGIEMFTRHPNAPTGTPAILVLGDAGPMQLGVASIRADETRLQVRGTAGQFDATVKLLAGGHASSKRTSFDFNGAWSVGSDSAGDGTEDFFVFGAGRMALRFDTSGNPIFRPNASVTPGSNGELSFQATSNTQLTFKLRGSDGTIRSGSIALS